VFDYVMKTSNARAAWLTILFLAPLQTLATSYIDPVDRDVHSPNKQYVLHIAVKSGLHTIAQNGEPNKILWSFRRRVWHDDYFVATNGNRVEWISWHYASTNDFEMPAIIVYSPSGENRMSFREIGGSRRNQDGGPVGDFWRLWREKAERKGERVAVAIPDGRTVYVDLSTGKITKGS